MRASCWLRMGLLLSLLALAACRKSQPSSREAPSASALPVSSGPKLPIRDASSLQVWEKDVAKTRYLLLSQSPPKLALRLKRPLAEESRVLLSVPGTYTSPDDHVEGAVVLEGRIVQARALSWEALLCIDGGKPELKIFEQAPSPAELSSIEKRGASAIQGHLLVGDGRPRPLKPSPALARRAIVTTPDGELFIVESRVAVQLGQFAADLVELGASRAMNLDMGKWSEGWYRDPKTEALVRPGEDYRATDRQTNWLVLLED